MTWNGTGLSLIDGWSPKAKNLEWARYSSPCFYTSVSIVPASCDHLGDNRRFGLDMLANESLAVQLVWDTSSTRRARIVYRFVLPCILLEDYSSTHLRRLRIPIYPRNKAHIYSPDERKVHQWLISIQNLCQYCNRLTDDFRVETCWEHSRDSILVGILPNLCYGAARVLFLMFCTLVAFYYGAKFRGDTFALGNSILTHI